MSVFLRSQVSSIIATAIDFIITFLLVQSLGIWAVSASLLGNASGAIAGFFLGKHWSFQAVDDGGIWEQAARYSMVWLGYMGLNFLMMMMAIDLLKSQYIVAKLAIALLLAFYNYFLQKVFVFNNARRE